MSLRSALPGRPRWLLRLLFVILWLVLIFTPCLALLLASQGEFRIRTGPAPEEEFRLWLVQDAERAGLALSHAYSQEIEDQRCFQTEARFLLWRWPGREEDTATSYCNCYEFADLDYQRPQFRGATCDSGSEAEDD